MIGRQAFRAAGVFVAALVTTALAAPGAAQELPGRPACELHVWVAGHETKPASPPRKNIFVRVVPQPADDPLSITNLFDRQKRVATLSDETLRRLLPNAGSVLIVRHADYADVDRDTVSNIRAPLSRHTTGCYADLVITLFVPIFAPNAAVGVLPAVMAGGDRLVVDFLFQRYTNESDKPFVVCRKNDSPLLQVVNYRPTLDSVIASSNENLASFADYVAKKSSH